MSQLDRIIEVNISRETQQIDIAAFDIPLILAQVDATGLGVDLDTRIDTFTTLKAVEEMYGEGSNVYKAVTSMLSGDLKPAEFRIGKVFTNLATIPIEGVVENTTEDTITGYSIETQATNGTATVNAQGEWSYTGNASYEGQDSFEVKVTYDTAPDETVTVTVDVVDNETYPYALLRCEEEDGSFYAVMADTHDDDVIKGLAQTVQAMRRMYFTSSSNKDIPTSSQSDLGTFLHDKGYFRTAILYSPTADTDFPEASWVGSQLIEIPGSNTWEYKRLAGVSISRITDTQISRLEDKGANYYINVKGAPITRRGTAADKAWIDEININSLLAA